MLDINKRYINRDYLENKLMIMRTHKNFFTPKWVHNQFYTCYFVREEKGFFYVGSISVFHSIDSLPCFKLVSIGNDYDVQYKNIKKTPIWFQELAENVKMEHYRMIVELFPKTNEKKENLYALNEKYLTEDIDLEDDEGFIYDAKEMIDQYNSNRKK